MELRSRADDIVHRAAEPLRQRVVDIWRDGNLTRSAIPLTAADEALLNLLVKRRFLRTVPDAEAASMAAFADTEPPWRQIAPHPGDAG